MAISRVHTWSSGEVLTASDLNAEFNNVLNNALSLISPLTGSLDFDNNTALNFRFQNQSATQSAAAEGVAYWQSTEDNLHISTGSVQARVPALTAIQAGELVGMTNPSGVDGATVFSRIQLGTGLTMSGTVLSSSAASTFTWHVRGLTGNTTTTTVIVNCDAVVLRNSAGACVRHESPGALTLDSAATGLNGRDQAGAFSASQTLHAYYISNGTTLKTVLADSAPTTGPDLSTDAAFSGYTYWAYIAPLVWNASSQFELTRLRGSWVLYEGPGRVLDGGTATSETSVSLSGFVPSNALRVRLEIEAQIRTLGGQSASHDTTLFVRTISGATGYRHRMVGTNSSAGLAAGCSAPVEIPNVSQTAYYLWLSHLAATETQLATLYVSAYNCANGGE